MAACPSNGNNGFPHSLKLYANIHSVWRLSRRLAIQYALFFLHWPRFGHPLGISLLTTKLTYAISLYVW